MGKVTDGEILATFNGRIAERDRVVALLSTLWEKILPTLPKPSLDQLQKWAHIHNYETEALEAGFRASARRLAKTPFADAQHPLQFISSVANSYRTTAIKKAA